MTTIKQVICGAAAVGLVAGTGFAAGAPTGHTAALSSSAVTAAELALIAEHVLLIGTDGTNLSKILEHAFDDDSGFKTAMDQGITGATTLVDHTTLSGPSWSTILTGVWDDKHGVFNNLFRPEPYTDWPTVFNLIEYHKPEVDTSIIADWDFLTKMAAAGGYPADNITYIPKEETVGEAADAQVTADTIAKIMALGQTPDQDSFIFSYQSQVDDAGHTFGGGSEEYAQAVKNVAGNIQQILAAVAQYEADNPGEQWTVIITTDHGHQQSLGFGHGFQSPNETSQFVIFSQAGDDDHDGFQNLDYSAADITPTILQLLGIPLRSDFDGVPMSTDPAVLDGIVEPVDLKQALTDAIDMFGYPNIGNDITLGVRTVLTSIPYLLHVFLGDAHDWLQSVVDQDIFLLSDLAGGVQWVLDTVGNAVVDVTNQLAVLIAPLTGSGVIAPTDPPLPLPPGGAEALLFDGSTLTDDAFDPGAAEAIDPADLVA